jgi:hypothetical protein
MKEIFFMLLTNRFVVVEEDCWVFDVVDWERFAKPVANK